MYFMLFLPVTKHPHKPKTVSTLAKANVLEDITGEFKWKKFKMIRTQIRNNITENTEYSYDLTSNEYKYVLEQKVKILLH